MIAWTCRTIYRVFFTKKKRKEKGVQFVFSAVAQYSFAQDGVLPVYKQSINANVVWQGS